MPNLLPLGYEDETVTEEERAADNPIGYLNGVAFDYDSGDFKLDGKSKILDSDGVESWKSWCINCIQTQRYAHLAYSTDFGIEWDLIFGAASREEAESILTRQMTEAILADPYERCQYIENIEINWTAPDAVEVAATLHGREDVTIDITAYITKEAA